MTKRSKRTQKLSWRRDDFERRFGFEGAPYFKVGFVLPFLMAVLGTIAFYFTLVYVPDCAFKRMFVERGWTQYAVVLLGLQTFFTLWIKTRKIKLQRAPLKTSIFPDDESFEFSVDTVDVVADKIAQLAESPKDFLLYRRALQALVCLRNIGQISEVDSLFSSQAERDENASETSYALVSGFLWAIPILGFVGTVMGLSNAIGGFTGALSATTNDMSELTDALRDVTSGLSTAFETTLVALTVALALQLFATFTRRAEEDLLDDISDYCAANIATKIQAKSVSATEIPAPRTKPHGSL